MKELNLCVRTISWMCKTANSVGDLCESCTKDIVHVV